MQVHQISGQFLIQQTRQHEEDRPGKCKAGKKRIAQEIDPVRIAAELSRLQSTPERRADFVSTKDSERYARHENVAKRIGIPNRAEAAKQTRQKLN